MPEYELAEKARPPLRGTNHRVIAVIPNENGTFSFRIGGVINQEFTEEDGRLSLTITTQGVSTTEPMVFQFTDDTMASVKIDDERRLTAYLGENPKDIIQRLRTTESSSDEAVPSE